jgi:hypothetical protein
MIEEIEGELNGVKFLWIWKDYDGEYFYSFIVDGKVLDVDDMSELVGDDDLANWISEEQSEYRADAYNTRMAHREWACERL